MISKNSVFSITLAFFLSGKQHHLTHAYEELESITTDRTQSCRGVNPTCPPGTEFAYTTCSCMSIDYEPACRIRCQSNQTLDPVNCVCSAPVCQQTMACPTGSVFNYSLCMCAPDVQ